MFQIYSLDPSLNLGYDKWSEMEQNDRRKFLFLIIEKCEAADPDIRLTAARVLLYLVQGIHDQHKPITRSLQLPHIPVMAFSQADLFLV